VAPKTTPQPGSGRALVPNDRLRSGIVKRLDAHAGTITTTVVRAISDAHPWYAKLGADERSWISMIVAAAVKNFAAWFDDDTSMDVEPASIFSVAPLSMTRQLTLQQTVDLMQTSIGVIEQQIDALMPKPDRPPLQTSLLYYSRQAAFAAAEVYARAAESRGAWDDHVEARVVDALVRGEADDAMLSQASTLGWPASTPLTVIVGAKPVRADAVDALHLAAERLGRRALGAIQGDRLVAVVSQPGAADDDAAVRTATALRDCFGDGPLVAGPVVPGLTSAHDSAVEAASGVAAAAGWRERPPVIAARDMLPERALTGNPEARRFLVDDVYRPLLTAGSDLLETCVGFLDHAGSIEATARDMYIHPNTVRYRIKRIFETTGYSPAVARDAYVLRLAITLGRLEAA